MEWGDSRVSNLMFSIFMLLSKSICKSDYSLITHGTRSSRCKVLNPIGRNLDGRKFMSIWILSPRQTRTMSLKAYWRQAPISPMTTMPKRPNGRQPVDLIHKIHHKYLHIRVVFLSLAHLFGCFFFVFCKQSRDFATSFLCPISAYYNNFLHRFARFTF